jgi:hypothetical protein
MPTDSAEPSRVTRVDCHVTVKDVVEPVATGIPGPRGR